MENHANEYTVNVYFKALLLVTIVTLVRPWHSAQYSELETQEHYIS